MPVSAGNCAGRSIPAEAAYILPIPESRSPVDLNYIYSIDKRENAYLLCGRFRDDEVKVASSERGHYPILNMGLTSLTPFTVLRVTTLLL